METNRQWFHQAQLFQSEVGRVEFFCRHHQVLGKCAISLYAQSLIELAGIGATTAAGSTVAATGVGGEGDIHSYLERRSPFISCDDGGRNLMPGNSRERDQWVAPAKGIQITPAQADHTYLQQEVVRGYDGIRHGLNLRLSRFLNDKCLHRTRLS